jgi:hypothetical protein
VVRHDGQGDTTESAKCIEVSRGRKMAARHQGREYQRGTDSDDTTFFAGTGHNPDILSAMFSPAIARRNIYVQLTSRAKSFIACRNCTYFSARRLCRQSPFEIPRDFSIG